MPKLKLDHTSALLARCKDGKKKTDYYDEAVTGFVLECRASGGKTYYLRYDRDGVLKMHKIGRYEDVTFAAAKKAAQRLRSQVVMGGDPAAAKADRKAVPLYAELAAMHMADAKLHQRSFSTTEAYVRNHLIPRFGNVRLTDIDSRAVAQWLAKKREEGLAPATVLKIKMIFQRSFELGARWGVAGCDKNPVRLVKTGPVNNARERFLSAEEAARLVEAARGSRNPLLPAIIQLLLLTGMRVSELLSARWENVDVDRKTLFVPTSKTGRSRHVPLAQAALEIIGGLPRRDKAVYLFPSPKKANAHLTDIKHGFQEARRKAGLEGTRVHDLRHTSCSFLISAGIDLFTAGKILGHATIQSTQRYSHLANSTLLAAVEAGAAKQVVTA